MIPYNQNAIGQIVNPLRKKKGYSQEILSGLANIARSHLAKIENGKKKANVETLWKIANALDLRLSDLFILIENACHTKDDDA